jgi:hypothetical protein
MGGSIRFRLLAFACAAFVLAAFAGPAAGASKRVERQPYTLGLDSAHICEVEVGGACFDLRSTDRYVTVEIDDASGMRADALYQFTDRYGALHQTGTICGKRRIRIPDGATDFDVFLQTATASLLACAVDTGTQSVNEGPAVATAGEVIATFEVGAPRKFPTRAFDAEQSCSAQPPAAFNVNGVTDGGETVSLDVVVLLDGVTKTAAQKVFATVAKSYSPLGVRFRVLTYRPVTFIGTDAPFLISQSKALYGGAVPKGADIVYAITTKDIRALNQSAVAGLADCIGGVRYANRAFAVGEVTAALPLDPFPLTFYGEGTARIAAHEIGHLMGGQHEQANCIQGIADLSPADPTPCTLMSNFADFVSRDFGVIESAVVRGHAVAFAKP